MRTLGPLALLLPTAGAHAAERCTGLETRVFTGPDQLPEIERAAAELFAPPFLKTPVPIDPEHVGVVVRVPGALEIGHGFYSDFGMDRILAVAGDPSHRVQTRGDRVVASLELPDDVSLTPASNEAARRIWDAITGVEARRERTADVTTLTKASANGAVSCRMTTVDGQAPRYGCSFVYQTASPAGFFLDAHATARCPR